MSTSNSQAVLKPTIKSGIFVAVALVVLVVIALELGANVAGLHDRAEYKAVFTDTSDLQVGDSVRVAGVDVGEVTDVDLADAAHATVAFSVNRTRPLPTDSTLTIRYLNLTGDRYLEVGRGVGGGVGTLEEGAEIPVAQTRPALDLDVLLAGFDPLFEGLAPEEINGLTSDLIAVLQGQGGTFESILTRIGSLTNTLADRDLVIGQVVTNLNTVLGTLDEKGPELAQTIDRLQILVSGLSGDRERIGDGLEATQRLVTSVDGFLDKARGPLVGTVDQIQRVADLANQGEENLNEVLGMLPGAYLRVSRVASRGAMYSLFICSLRVKVTGPDGQPLYSPMVGPSDNIERCRDDDVAPLETPEQREVAESAQAQGGGR
ncbi:MCE family protein [Pseudonocardia xishanensis]|uniref:MCE family protein n=1 Tax=Pseudonocardia xishanensis TaxID=630995 RepID=A0ABP8RU80_9PSEU